MNKYIKLGFSLLLPIFMCITIFQYLPIAQKILLVLLIILYDLNEIRLYLSDCAIKNSETINEIYKKHWLNLCNQILVEIDEDGWCRLVITKENALKMKIQFENGLSTSV